MSSSRDQTTFTGAPTALETTTACTTKSTSRPAAEPAAQKRPVDRNLLFGEPGHLCDHDLSQLGALQGSPDLAALRGDVGGAVHRLHGGVGEELGFVLGGVDLGAVAAMR